MSNSSNSSSGFSCDGIGRSSGSTTAVLVSFSYAVLIPLIVFGNGLVVIAFVINQKLRTATNIFICGLGLSDLLIGVFSVPYWTYISSLNSLMDAYCDPLYSVYICIDIGTGCASILQLTAIAIERLYFTVAPLKHRRLRRSVYWYMVAIAWIFSILAAGLQPWQEKGKWYNEYSLFLLISCFLFPLIIIIVVYSYIFKVSREQSRRRSSTASRMGSSGGNIKEFNMFVTVLVITGVFIIAWAPFFITTVIATFCHDCIIRIQSEHLVRFVKWMQYSSSAINPYIYAYRNEDVRSSFKKVLRICICNGCQDQLKPQSSTTSQTHREKCGNNNRNSSSQTASKESVENGTIIHRFTQSLNEGIPGCGSPRELSSCPNDGRLKDIQPCFDNAGFTYPNVSKQRDNEKECITKDDKNWKRLEKLPDVSTQQGAKLKGNKLRFDNESLDHSNVTQKRNEKESRSTERNMQRKEHHTRRSNELNIHGKRRDFPNKQQIERQAERRENSRNNFDKRKNNYENEAPIKLPRGVSRSQQRERQKAPQGRSYDNSTETNDGKISHSIGSHSDHFQSRQSHQNRNQNEKRDHHHIRSFDNPVDITNEMSSTYV